MQRRSIGVSDVGLRRMSNEDAFLADDDLGVYAVADGMGGHKAGEVASQEAIDTLLGMVRRGGDTLTALDVALPGPEALRKARRLLESAIQAATYMVYGIAQSDPTQHGMGTTLSALLVRGGIGISAQVGDSRIYLSREGVISQLTEDHTLIAWQIKQGIITEAEAEASPHKNVITRAVGSRDYVQVDTQVFPVYPGDRYLLCSDGLHGYLNDAAELLPFLAKKPEDAARELIALSNQRGGRDNITAIVLHLT